MLQRCKTHNYPEQQARLQHNKPASAFEQRKPAASNQAHLE